MPSKTIEDFAYQVRDYMRSAEVVEGKNKLHPTNKSITPKGATITYNSDGTISKSGTVSGGDAQYAYAVPTNADYEFPADLDNGEEYVLSGCPSGGSANTYEIYIQFRNADNTGWSDAYHDYGDGVSFTANSNRFSVYVRIFNGNTDTLTFSPMICTKEEWEKSHTYETYYRTISDRVQDIDNKADITAIAKEENGATASKAYNINDHFYKDGKFCTAIAYIGSGATLTLNTNYIADTIGNSLYNSSLMHDYYGAMACVLLSNQAKTYLTINNSKYMIHFMIIMGNGGNSVFMGLLSRKYDDSLTKVLLGGTDLIASGDVICENTGSKGLTLKFPNFSGGSVVWILSMSGTSLEGITTGTYT